MKKTIALAATLIIAFTLAACSGGNEAPSGNNSVGNSETPGSTDSTPGTSQSGESTPDGNGAGNTAATPEPPCEHDWIDANCETPETCPKCGDVQGEPLGHDWKEANFQEPETCLLCGATQGEPLTPGFVKHGMEANAVAGVAYPYVTVTVDNDLETIGEVMLTEMSTASSYNGFDAEDGFEFIIAKFVLTFRDDNSNNHGVNMRSFMGDYYTFDPSRESGSIKSATDSHIPGFRVGREVNYYGEDYEWLVTGFYDFSCNNGISTAIDEYVFYVPEGYDGMVIMWYNAKNRLIEGSSLTIGEHFDDDTVIFRLIGGR